MRPSNICYMNEFPLDGVFANDNSGKPLLPAKSSLRVPLAGLVERVRSVLDKIATQRIGATTPPLILNRHCAECEFQMRCRQIAVEKDDLSSLSPQFLRRS